MARKIRHPSAVWLWLAIWMGSGSVADAQTSTPTTPPQLTVSLNSESFVTGQTMMLSATLTPGSDQSLVDAYIVVQVPTGQFLSLQLGTSLVPGIVPVARAFTPFEYQGGLLQYTFTGAEPVGAYTFYAGLARPGSLDFVTPIQQLVLTFDRLGPETARLELSRAFAAGELEVAKTLLGVTLADALAEISATDRADIARALEGCSIVDSTPRHEVCATADGEFRFVFVRDEQRRWRVVTW